LNSFFHLLYCTYSESNYYFFAALSSGDRESTTGQYLLLCGCLLCSPSVGLSMLYQILEHCRLPDVVGIPLFPFIRSSPRFPCTRLCMVDTFFKPAHLHCDISQFANTGWRTGVCCSLCTSLLPPSGIPCSIFCLEILCWFSADRRHWVNCEY
jgi:hypothetical protein